MKRRMRLCSVLVALACVVSILVACGGDGENKDTGMKVFHSRTNSIVVGLNPILNTTAPDNGAHSMICEPLVRYCSAPGNTTILKPAAAESWDVSEDGKTYTFHLHKDMKWSDGVPFTAKDYEYTLKLMADPDTAATNAWLYDGVIENFGKSIYGEDGKGPEDIGVKAIDDVTLEIRLEHPAAYFLELLHSMYPVRQDKYEEWGEAYGSSAEKIICSGQFKVQSWSQNTELVVVRNEYNWNAKNIKLDKIVQKVIQEPATAVQAFINGEIDSVGTSDLNWQKTIEAADMANSIIVPGTAPEFLMFNLKDEYLQNTKIRQALSISYDRQNFVDTIFDGQAFPIYSTMPDTMKIGEKTYTEWVGGKNYFIKELQNEYPDPKELFREGLKELGKSDDLSKVTVRYASRGTSEISKKIAEWYKQTWETNLGITVEIDMMEWNVMWDKIDAGDFDIAVGGWGPYYNEPSAILNLFHPENGYFNADKIGWKDENSKKFKELCEKAVNVVDESEKAKIYLEAEKLLVKNAVISPEYLDKSPSFLAKYVKDFHISTVGAPDWSEVDIQK